jgi:cell shape-determining protein MreC
MKSLTLIMIFALSFSLAANENKKIKKVKSEVVKAKTAAAAVPCESKEDLLKKLEEKKKLEAEKNKGFSLQGGSTGCSVK